MTNAPPKAKGKNNAKGKTNAKGNKKGQAGRGRGNAW